MKFYRIDYGDCMCRKFDNREQTVEWATNKREAERVARENDDGDYKSRVTEIEIPMNKSGLLEFLNENIWR